jgi:hypothetical protein
LRALIVGRLIFPAGGRGTDRDKGELEGAIAPGLAPAGAENDLTLLCGGRGTFWFIAICGALRFATAGLLTPRFDIAPGFELPRLCGGRGTDRPAGAGRDLALVGGIARLDVSGAALRAAGLPVLCEAATAGDGLDAVGLIRLTVGRDAMAADGCAAGKPAFGPSTLARVGATFGLPILAVDRFRKAPGEILAAFDATGSPRTSVFRETAVSAPGLLA